MCNLPKHDVRLFEDAIRIYNQKKSVQAYDYQKLEAMQSPTVTIKAQYEGLGASASSEESGGLEQSITLCVGARVMLTENVWVDQGLVDGALGTVVDIVWRAETNPFAVMIKFDKYTGAAINTDNGLGVPIFQSRHTFMREEESAAFIQFPLTVAYAITTHKSQGMTVDRAVLDISGNDFTPGLTYVAVSRVKKLAHIMLERPFDYHSRFVSKESPTQTMRREDAVRGEVTIQLQGGTEDNGRERP